MTESATPERGSLSVEQAVASLVEPPVEQEADAAVEAADAQEPQGETSTPEEAEAQPEEQAEGEEGAETEEAEPLPDPPLYWSPEGKAKWADLSPEARAEILAQEGPRETAVAKAKAEAAEKAKAAETELGKVGQLAEALAERLPKWLEAFESRWGTQTPDWSAVAQEHGVEAMTLAKVQFEAERDQLAQAHQAQQIAQTQAHQAFVKAEFAKLSDVEPELADPEKGAERRKATVEHAIQRGIPPEAIQNVSAAELSLAYDAMRYRQLKAAAATPPKPKPAASAQKAPVRPAAAASQLPPGKQAAATAKNRFSQTGSIEDAVALLSIRNN